MQLSFCDVKVLKVEFENFCFQYRNVLWFYWANCQWRQLWDLRST